MKLMWNDLSGRSNPGVVPSKSGSRRSGRKNLSQLLRSKLETRIGREI
jgi:hypothetical protein